MTSISLIGALLWEQWRPVHDRNQLAISLLAYVDLLKHYFNTGIRYHGTLAWFVAVMPILFCTGIIYYLLDTFSPILGWMWNIVVLYFTMSFRQFNQSLADIAQALKNEDLPQARELLKQWSGVYVEKLNGTEIIEVTIRSGLIYSYHRLFSVLICFAILPGPIGPVLYRLAELMGKRWGSLTQDEGDSFGHFSTAILKTIDWLPTRLTAISFAIVGNFEDAVYCWKMQATLLTNRADGIILVSGAGALGVRLGDFTQKNTDESPRLQLGGEKEANINFLQGTVNLIWRTLLLWLLLLLVIG